MGIIRTTSHCAYSKRVTFAEAPHFRRQRPGPETDLVDRFLSDLRIKVAPGCELVVFREPRLVSGFPDVVIVAWERAKAATWLKQRRNLVAGDLQVVHYLHQCHGTDQATLESVFSPAVRKNLARLEAAGVVRNRVTEWSVVGLADVFAVRDIIAVEAKMSEWKAGLEQAFVNTWFSSASYLLVPDVPRRSGLEERACELGVGLRTPTEVVVKSQRGTPLPASYASWLFNEWSWRAISRVE